MLFLGGPDPPPQTTTLPYHLAYLAYQEGVSILVQTPPPGPALVQEGGLLLNPVFLLNPPEDCGGCFSGCTVRLSSGTKTLSGSAAEFLFPFCFKSYCSFLNSKCPNNFSKSLRHFLHQPTNFCLLEKNLLMNTLKILRFRRHQTLEQAHFGFFFPPTPSPPVQYVLKSGERAFCRIFLLLESAIEGSGQPPQHLGA